jgi:formamidopyrimidine-DNA glycosylase
VCAVSIELPEARILAAQMNEALPGKTVESYDLRDIERMVKIGFIRNVSDFGDLVGRKITGVASRGNTIRVCLDGGMNLLIGPEYGGVIRLVGEGGEVPKYHLRLDFADGSRLTVRITSMGIISALKDGDLEKSYLYRRDFLGGVSPDSEEFTFERFQGLMGGENRQIKPLLVGKDALFVGLSNSTFQDAIYRAGVHPKRRASELSGDELRALYNAIKAVIEERLRLGGKDEFTDLYGNRGGYTPAMGPNMKGRDCPKCGAPIERLAYGGGHVYLCPGCQRQ